jgi:urocanate hydratase
VIVNSTIAAASTILGESSEVDRLGLEMFAQMTAGSWIHVGAQGILQGTYEVFAAAALKHFGDDLAGRFVVAGGMGRMGGAQALAATLNGAAFLGVEVHQERIKQCIRAGYCDFCVNSLDEAIRILKNAVRKKQGVSVGLVGNCAEVIPELARRGIVPDLLTDQTDAYDLLNGYIPAGFSFESAVEQRRASPEDYLKRCYESISLQVSAMLALQKLGSVVFDFGNNLCAVALERGSVKDARNIPGFFKSYIGPLLDDGCVPVRWVALSGEARDIHLLDEVALELLAHDAISSRWIRQARRVVKFQGLPARVCWMGRAEQGIFQERVNHLVAKGQLKGPIVMGSTQMDLNDAARSFLKHERESIDGPPIWNDLSELLNANSGAAWVSLNQSGNPGAGNVHASGQVVVADGSLLPNSL